MDKQQVDGVALENILTAQVDANTTVRVIRNMIAEDHPVEIVGTTEHGVTVRGGELGTYILMLLVSERDRGRRYTIAWTHTEWTKLDKGRHPYESSPPTVLDIALRGESLLVLHIAKSKMTLTRLEPGPEPDSLWKTLDVITLDWQTLQSLSTRGVTGRIIQLDDRDYLDFDRLGAREPLVFRIEDDHVQKETDDKVIRAVIDAVKEQPAADAVKKEAEGAATRAASSPAEPD